MAKQEAPVVKLTTLRENPFVGGKNAQVVISPGSINRPWSVAQGQSRSSDQSLPPYEQRCYLCPGNQRSSGARTPNYTGTYSFPNDNPVFSPPRVTAESSVSQRPRDLIEETFFRERQEPGISQVLVYAPQHNLTMRSMEHAQIEEVIDMWAREYTRIGGKPFINHIATFENRGSDCGNSQPHPHGQIWAEQTIPNLAVGEYERHEALSGLFGSNAMVVYAEAEIAKDKRVVYANDNFGLIVPNWAVLPYETMIIPRRAVSSVNQFTDAQVTDLAKTLWVATNAYAKVFDRPNQGAQYVMTLHQRPTNGGAYPNFQTHIDFSPPFQDVERLKYPGGYGTKYGAQRDFLPEDAADVLKAAVATLSI